MASGIIQRFGAPAFAAALATALGAQAPAPPAVPPLAAPAAAVPPAPAPNANPACVRLEASLANLERTNGEAARAEQLRRYEEAAERQQQELDRMTAQAQRAGCTGPSFFLFGGGQPPQCDRLNNQIQNMRANLDRIQVGLQQLQGSRTGSDAQRRQILGQLAQNNCGPQYRTAAAPPPASGGLFDSLFGNNSPPAAPDATTPQSGTFRTVCVRTCDGFYFPVSYATVPSKFSEDERVCQRMCPGSEVALYSYRNPGEDMAHAVSTNGRRYSELPTAFKYRQEFNAACTCRGNGQNWSDALKQDDTIQRGDVVVNEENARALSQPKQEPPAKNAKQNTRAGKGEPKAPPKPAETAAPAPEPAPPATQTEAPPNGKRTVRTVGPPMVATPSR
jgi:Protein of unknown function (DUF2865)